MTQLQIIVLYIAFDIALTKAYISAQLRNYCAINLKPRMSMTVGDLLNSVITQMQLNAGGSISCITIIADQAGDQYATGNTLYIEDWGFLYKFQYQVQFFLIIHFSFQ